jgi:hypothetical protein
VSVALGAALARARLVQRSSWVIFGVAVFFVLVVGALERQHGAAYALDRTLLGAAFGVGVPLLAYGFFELALGRGRPSVLLGPLLRHGADGRGLSFGAFGVLSAWAASGAAVLAVVAVLAAGVARERFGAELFACAWGGALAGLAYAGLFALGSHFGRRGRLLLLLGDWLLGSGSGPLALPFPRAEARSLLGGEPVLELSQMTALVVLVLVASVGLLAAVSLERR